MDPIKQNLWNPEYIRFNFISNENEPLRHFKNILTPNWKNSTNSFHNINNYNSYPDWNNAICSIQIYLIQH
jgi:hypothetical protein